MTVQHPTVICVIGSARSGTSLVTRLINQLGVYLGPSEHLLMELDWNPEGCWEHLILLDVNERIFRKFGGTGVNPPVLPLDWQASPQLEDLRTRARTTIAEDFVGHPIWGWKDPTTCLTLPFWQDIVPDMRYVICVRNPVDVVASMAKHWNWSLPVGMWSWLERNAASVLYTSGQSRLFFSFDDFFQAPEEQLARLATFVGQPLPGHGTAEFQDLLGSVKPALHNFQSPTESVLADPQLVEGEKYFYLALLEACRQPEGSEPDTTRLMDAYRGAVRGRYQRLHQQFEAYAKLTQGELEEAQLALARAQSEQEPSERMAGSRGRGRKLAEIQR